LSLNVVDDGVALPPPPPPNKFLNQERPWIEPWLWAEEVS